MAVRAFLPGKVVVLRAINNKAHALLRAGRTTMDGHATMYGQLEGTRCFPVSDRRVLAASRAGPPVRDRGCMKDDRLDVRF